MKEKLQLTSKFLEAAKTADVEFQSKQLAELLSELLEKHPQLKGLFQPNNVQCFRDEATYITKTTLCSWIFPRDINPDESHPNAYIDSWIKIGCKRVQHRFGITLKFAKNLNERGKQVNALSVSDCIYLFYCFHEYTCQHPSQFHFVGEPAVPAKPPASIPNEFRFTEPPLADLPAELDCEPLGIYFVQSKVENYLSPAEDLSLRQQVVAAVRLANLNLSAYTPDQILVLQQGREAVYRLVRSVMHYAVKMATKFVQQDILLEDLIQVANLALTEAAFVVRDDPANSFITYAHYEIIHALQLHVRAHRKARGASATQTRANLSLDATGVGGLPPLRYVLPDYKPSVEAMVMQRQQLRLLKKALNDSGLSEKEKFVVTKRFGLDGGAPMSQEAVGNIMPDKAVTREAVRLNEGKAIEKIRKYLKAHQRPRTPRALSPVKLNSQVVLGQD